MSNLANHKVMQNWFETASGRYIAQWATKTSEALLSDVFGLQAAQIGCEYLDLMANNRIQHRFICMAGKHGTPIHHSNQPTFDVEIDACNLPFDSNTLDLIVLPFILEIHPNPHQVLREAYRVLRPEGQLLILGFNPISLWGLRNYLGKIGHPNKMSFPWPANYLSVLRLKDWLKLLNFEVARGHFGCYAPPCNYDNSFERLKWLELAGNRWWAFAGACYAVTAIKRITSMTLLTPNWIASDQQPRSKSSLVTEKNPSVKL